MRGLTAAGSTHLRLALTVRELKQLCLERIQTDEAFARFRTVSFDTIKKYTTFQGYKVPA